MYSPKIAEDLIPLLYRLAKARGMRMTKLVDEMLRTALERCPSLRNRSREGATEKGGE